MRHYEIIREYSRDKTVENWGQKMWDRISKDRDVPKNDRDVTDPEEQQKVIARYLEILERADPTKNNQYVQNLIKFYIAGSRLEDLQSTAVEYLTKFQKLKARKMIPSPHNDIGRYADFRAFATAIDEYPDPESKEEMPKGNAKEVYKDANVRIIAPEDEQAACYYGQGTRWCTAATNGTNMFTDYRQTGPIYILIPTKQQYPGEKYQISPHSDEYMNEQDEPLDIMDLKERFGTPGFLGWWKSIHKSIPMTVRGFVNQSEDNREIFQTAWRKISDYAEKLIDYYLDTNEIDEDEADRLRRSVIDTSNIELADALDDADDNEDRYWPLSAAPEAFFNYLGQDVDWGEKEIYSEIADLAASLEFDYNEDTGEIDIKYPPKDQKAQKAQKVEPVGQEDQLDKEIDQLNKNALLYLARQKVDNVP